MNFMAAVRYAIRDGVRLVVRHWGMSALTVFTAMAVFFVIGASTLFVLNVKNIVSSMENQLNISAYVKDGADLNAVAKKIKVLPNIVRTDIVTKEAALDRLRSRIGAQSKAVTLLGSNPLPPSIEIKVDKASNVAETARMLISIPEVDDIVYAGHLAEKLSKVSGFIESFSIIMLIVAIASSAVVLFNTIRIAVYSKEEEIGIMLRVGATATYVMLPFVIQGFILGLAGALIASAILAATYYAALDGLKGMLPFLHFIDSPGLMLKLMFMLVSCGTAVSLLSSLFAVENFIRKAAKPL